MTRATALTASLLALLSLAALAVPAASQSSSPAPEPGTVTFAVSPAAARPGEPVKFNDTTGDAFRNATRQWDFGDGGKAVGRSVAHAFAAEGDYKVRLTIGLRSATQVVRVALPAPVAAFDVDPARPVAGHPVAFIDRSLDEDDLIVNWTWDFGDGSAAYDELRPRHTYAEPGVYTVALSVADEAGHRGRAVRTVEVRLLVPGESPPLPTNLIETDYSTPAPAAPLAAAAFLGLALLLRRRA